MLINILIKQVYDSAVDKIITKPESLGRSDRIPIKIFSVTHSNTSSLHFEMD